MKIFGYSVFLYSNNEWEQLEVLWNKEAYYNWLEFTIFHLSWRSRRIKKLENTSDLNAKNYKFPKTHVEVNFGLLGLNFILIVAKL